MVGSPAVAVAAVLLLGCCVAVGAWDFDYCCSCTVVRCVPLGSLVIVPCPDTPLADDGDVSFRLNKSGPHRTNESLTHDFDGTKYVPSTLLDGGLVVNVAAAKRPTAFHLNRTAPPGRRTWFALANVTAEDEGMHCCSAKVLNPRPVVTRCDAPVVELQVEGHQCEAPVVCHPGGSGALEASAAPGGPWLWIGMVVGLVVYALLVTVVASVKIVRMNRDESAQNEYMNTKHVAH